MQNTFETAGTVRFRVGKAEAEKVGSNFSLGCFGGTSAN